MIIFFIIGLIIGLNTKIISTMSIFLLIYIGSLFGSGQLKVFSILIFFIFSIFIVRKIKKIIQKNFSDFTYLF
jgi:hypothetical protein